MKKFIIASLLLFSILTSADEVICRDGTSIRPEWACQNASSALNLILRPKDTCTFSAPTLSQTRIDSNNWICIICVSVNCPKVKDL